MKSAAHRRVFFDPASRQYVAAHLDEDQGEPRVLNTLLFETQAGEAIGAVPLDPPPP